MNVKIKEIPLSDRPRERLVSSGVENLSNEELLAIILKTGTKEMSAKNLANLILKEVDGINNLSNVTLEKLTNIKGIGNTKACELLASIELGKRINTNIDNINKIKIVNANNIFDYYKYSLKSKNQEHFYVVYLNTKNQIIKDKLLFIGTVNQSLIHPREIFKEAYLCNSSSIICIHNHPSGITEPSDADIGMTNRLKEVGLLLGIKVLDHIIIGKDTYFSFTENGLI